MPSLSEMLKNLIELGKKSEPQPELKYAAPVTSEASYPAQSGPSAGPPAPRRSFEEIAAAKRAALEAQGMPIPPDWDLRVSKSDIGIWFRVDDVEVAKDPIELEPLSRQLEDSYEDALLIPPEEHLVKARHPHAVGVFKSLPKRARRSLAERVNHPLVDAVHIAFAEHRPLLLSPDAIWLTVAQGFSNHVKENAEALRASFVRHQGKRTIMVRADALTRAAFIPAIAEICSYIAEQVNPVVHEALICNFSTTTPAARTASEIAMMDTFSSYFEYGISVCGIPSVTLQGTSSDWESMRSRIEVLSTYKMEWWVKRLRPIFDELVSTAQGRPNPQFWRAIYKPKEAYGGDVITGWLADLFPYLGLEAKKRRSHVLDCDRHNWALKV